jgi:twitching motility protein PilT
VLRKRAPDLSTLGLPVPLDWVVEHQNGLVLITGATGSGKSTTLAALAQRALEKRPGMLITLEDPIEYTYGKPALGSLIRQREIGRHVASYATGLRDALREDPDILLVGEMRDAESIHQALTAAETGHLVLASLHSRTAPSAVQRIVDVYPPERQHQIRSQLADSLRVVVSQRLLPRASGRGRVPAVEILNVNHGAAHLIREGKIAQLVTTIQTGSKENMISMQRCLDLLAQRGHIAPLTKR